MRAEFERLGRTLTQLPCPITKDAIERALGQFEQGMAHSDLRGPIRVVQAKLFLHCFYPIAPDLVPFCEPSTPLFGEKVHKKFRAARDDIRLTGECLALGQSTACVFHLMRAMEAAVRKFGRQSSVTITPQTTWVVLTGGMDGKIKKMLETTAQLAARKDV